MPLSTHSNVWRTLTLIAAVITALLLVCLQFMELFLTLLLGLALIVITRKLVSDFRANAAQHHHSRWRRRVAGYGLVAFWLFATVFLLSNSLDQISGVVQKAAAEEDTLRAIYVAEAVPYLPEWFSAKVLTPERVGVLEARGLAWITNAFTGISELLLYGLTIIPIMFYVHFRQGEEISVRIQEWVPESLRKRYAGITREIGENLYEYFRARIIETVAVGSICCLGFYVGGVKGWLVLGLLAGVLNIADFVGPALSALPPIVISLLADDPIAALIAVCTIVAAQLIDNFYLVPFMISSRVALSPLTTILLALVGAKLLGIVGIILAIPIYLVYKITLRGAYSELVETHDPASVS